MHDKIKNKIQILQENLMQGKYSSTCFFFATGDEDPKNFVVAEALAACHYISIRKDKIFHILHKALNSTNSELQAAAHECMKKVRQLKALCADCLQSMEFCLQNMDSVVVLSA